MLQHGDKVFISYSGSSVDANYKMGLLTASASANLLDPASWSKSATPVFESSEANGIYGPGSNSFTTDPDGARSTSTTPAATRAWRWTRCTTRTAPPMRRW